MDLDRWRRIQTLFHEALDRDPADRRSFLKNACDGDVALRDEALELLDASDRAEGVFAQAVRGTLELATDLTSDEPFGAENKGRRIGPYQLDRELGRGGMSTVYLAQRDDEFHMWVAIKLIRRGLDTQDILRRLRQERQILAHLDHPNIARLLDGGTTEDGQPYFAMEHVEGEPVDQYCDHGRLSISQRVELFQQICSAVQYAHQNLVIHRDLKPSNILVTASGTVKLLDFGIAKLLKSDRTQEDPTQTKPAHRLLTPEYASPEQFRGQPLTTATDVYSLGVLLYRLLTGISPYFPKVDGWRDVEKAVLEAEPTRPSQAPSPASMSTTRDGSPAKLRHRLAGDLDNIVLMALRKEPERRYASVRQLSEDLRRHLAGLTVSARPDTLGYRWRKFVGRHRVIVAWSATALLLLTTLAGFYTIRLRQERAQAMKAEARATQVTDFLISLLENADPGLSRGVSISVGDVLAQGAKKIKDLADQPDLQASLMGLMGGIYHSLAETEMARPLLANALAIRQRLHGDEHVETARAKIELEELLYDLGDYDQARRLLEEALATDRRLLGEPHEDIALALNNLGTVYFGENDLLNAARLLSEAQAMWLELGVESQDALTGLHNLAVVTAWRDDFETAEGLFHEAIERKRSFLGEDHPDYAEALFNLAVLYRDRDPEQAVQLAARARDLQLQLFGTDHPDVYRTTHYLAFVLEDQEDFAAAESLLQKASEEIRRSGSTSAEAADLLQAYASFLQKREKLVVTPP